ncbi:MAG: bifunctional isocitrate dehydrogenase kinase/phosphatase [Rhodospirillales bacterium]|nr:MAG: bifunctional isocitrate dehydrogenase kinase/phosphatase [Rhodospirillales bacterium]
MARTETDRTIIGGKPRPGHHADVAAAIDAFGRIGLAWDREEAIQLTAECILGVFDVYHAECRRITWQAKTAFEELNPADSLLLSRRRLTIYSDTIHEIAARLHRAFPGLVGDEALWQEVEAVYFPLVAGRYEEDLAIAYIHSVRRMLYQDEWKPVEYSFGTPSRAANSEPITVFRELPGARCFTPELVTEILKVPGFSRPFQDMETDAEMAARRLNREFDFDGERSRGFRGIHIVNSGFYRNRGAYVVGRIVMADGGYKLIVLSLENHTGGIFVDAVLTSEADAHNLFSSSLANFHVTIPHYHELAAFLHSIMPRRPLGLHYSTIGFNHVGKVAVAQELERELQSSGDVFDTAVGFRGTVAIGFSAPSSDYVLKVIRNEPTEQYKWGAFQGIPSVLEKYSRVHEINRTGSMLDNLIYYNIRLNADWFAPELREELLAEASRTVTRQGDFLVFKHLIVQMKMSPLPVFLESASREDARTAIVNLGHCIRNNAAANVFNRDLDGRNYGVSPYLKVYLFDYDAVEPLTDIKVRTNTGRLDGEEDVADWFFEDGIVFLPEEIDVGLRIPDRELRRLFREAHSELLGTAYWQGVQRALRQGLVPRLRVYPDEARLRPRRIDHSRV